MALAGYLCRSCHYLLASSAVTARKLLQPRLLSTNAEPSSKSSDRQHEEEVAKFDRLSATWWADDKDPLFLMNSVRVPLVKSVLAECESEESTPPRILDVGCGGGYLAEELAKQRFSVTAVDPSREMIDIASKHAAKYAGDLDLEYRVSTVEEVSEQFDVVVSSEVVEHVPCVKTFVTQCASKVKPGGGLMFTTINRTVQSWLFGILLAEHVVGLVPPGTHEYKKLVPPEILTGVIADCGFEVLELTGLRFNPITRQWSKTSDMSINYAVTAIRSIDKDCSDQYDLD